MNNQFRKCLNYFGDGDFEAALKESEKLLKTSKLPQAFYNHGVILAEMNRHRAAIPFFEKVRDLRPDDSVIHLQLAYCHLRSGNYKEGLKEAEWRFTPALADSHMPNPITFKVLPKAKELYPKPLYNGQEGRIIVFNEQGFGDAIMASRYIDQLGDKVLFFHVAPELEKLFKCLNTMVVAQDPKEIKDLWVYNFSNERKRHLDLPIHDYVMSVNSLYHWLDPNLDNINTKPYLWTKEWTNPGRKVIKNCKKLKIGIVWAGSDKDEFDRLRSIPLKTFKPLEMDHVQFFSLQLGKMKRKWPKGNHFEEIDLLQDGIAFVDLAEYIQDFSDTAELMQELDLVITVDTAAAHLAGALGEKVWLLLPEPCYEWRWQKRWYDNMEVFRQKTPGDWSYVIEQLKNRLLEGKSEPLLYKSV